MKNTKSIIFKPRYSPEVELHYLDNFTFQWSGEDEDGEYIMYNNIAQVVEVNGELAIEWNGNIYPAMDFLTCWHLDGNISMDSVKLLNCKNERRSSNNTDDKLVKEHFPRI